MYCSPTTPGPTVGVDGSSWIWSAERPSDTDAGLFPISHLLARVQTARSSPVPSPHSPLSRRHFPVAHQLGIGSHNHPTLSCLDPTRSSTVAVGYNKVSPCTHNTGSLLVVPSLVHKHLHLSPIQPALTKVLLALSIPSDLITCLEIQPLSCSCCCGPPQVGQFTAM